MSRVAEETIAGNGKLEPRTAVLDATAETPAIGDECPVWTTLMTAEEWDVYQAAIQAVRSAGVRFLIGGAFGLAAYTGRWRNTKDIDLFVLPQDRERAVETLLGLGFKDYYETLAYDRGWIYRATRSDVIVDVIWGTPNRRTEVDEQWHQSARRVLLRSELVEVIPAEELLWIKLYVLQRDRCDWPDLINLLYATAASLDWDRVVERLAGDLPLLTGLLSVFAWVCPDQIGNIPAALRKRAGIQKPRRLATGPNLRHIELLDSRKWFAADQPCDQPIRL
jgi:hypothetical protein